MKKPKTKSELKVLTNNYIHLRTLIFDVIKEVNREIKKQANKIYSEEFAHLKHVKNLDTDSNFSLEALAVKIYSYFT